MSYKKFIKKVQLSSNPYYKNTAINIKKIIENKIINQKKNSKYFMTLSKKKFELSWCKNCLNNSLRPRISFDERGWCNACQWMEEKKNQLEFQKKI